jgi:hypothetical protein
MRTSPITISCAAVLLSLSTIQAASDGPRCTTVEVVSQSGSNEYRLCDYSPAQSTAIMDSYNGSGGMLVFQGTADLPCVLLNAAGLVPPLCTD